VPVPTTGRGKSENNMHAAPKMMYACYMHLNTPTAHSPEDAVLLMVMQVGKHLRQRRPGDEVDPATVPLLHVLSCTGAIRLSDLAARMHLDASTVSRHARQLEERGLISRTADPDDRRASRVEITELGGEALAASFEQRKQMVGRILAGWPAEDQRALQRLATRFVADLHADDEHMATSP
jgi:DNA-binding MarR family transcriptional regulator